MVRREQSARIKRYLISYLRHVTMKRMLNLFRVEYKLAGNDPDLAGAYPYSLIVDISNACNLKCPLCLMGQRMTIARENKMSFERYRALLDPIKDYLFQVSLYNWGEPFLNRDVYRIIRYSADNNLGTVLSSNLNIPIDPERLVESGLEHLVISADGVSQGVYEKYRIGGSIDAVLDNLKGVVKAKRIAGSRSPHIEWQCLVTKYNEHQLKDIKNYALDAGVNEVRFCNINFFSAEDMKRAEGEWLPENPVYRAFGSRGMLKPGASRRPCFWLWRVAVVNADGGMTPCCFFDTPDWDNVLERPFLSAWNNNKYHAARTRFRKGRAGTGVKLVCDECPDAFIK